MKVGDVVRQYTGVIGSIVKIYKVTGCGWSARLDNDFYAPLEGFEKIG